ncbi:protein of unknown function [Escherichia coli]|nr:protein of unknown function [Escherichia coli]
MYRQLHAHGRLFFEHTTAANTLQLTNLHQSTINLHTLLCDICQPLNMRFVIYA